MSPRFLGLLTTTAAASLTLTAGIAAAAASLAAPPPSPAVPAPPQAPSTPPAPAAPSPVTAPSLVTAPSPDTADSHEADDDPSDCWDADCEITIRDDQTIRLDRRFGLGPVHISVDGTRVTLTIHSKRNSVMSTLEAGPWSHSTATYNGVTFQPRMNKDGTITLKISH